eukprot:gb/GEZN01020867.1/.p1 GENE.gb/GEZN01020867.1/~~gb/GEZN01020867.1/.p1  ORF type:complete len:155 (-),score=36.58 gb/GEZN01020867.1/:115-579(-)
MSGPPAFELPVATVTKIAKHCLPSDAQIGKEAKTAFARAAGIFALYLAHTANDIAKTSNRSTISAKDVLEAVEEIEFEEFLEPLEKCLKAFQKEHEKKPGAGGGKKKKSPAKGDANAGPSKKMKLVDDDADEDLATPVAGAVEPALPKKAVMID